MPKYKIAGKDFDLVAFPSLKIAIAVEKLTGFGIMGQDQTAVKDSKKMAEAMKLMLVGDVSALNEDNVSDVEFMAVLNDFFILRQTIAQNLIEYRKSLEPSLPESVA